MQALQAEHTALRQQHEFTIMQLTDLKQKYESIKKLNTTILENMMKEPCQFMNQIRLVIEGDGVRGRVGDEGEGELERLRAGMGEEIEREVERRVKEILGTMKGKCDGESCETCRERWGKCLNCPKYLQRIKTLQKALEQKSSLLDKHRLQLDTQKSQLQLSQTKKSQADQINKILKANIKDLQEMLKEHEEANRKLNQEWQREYGELGERYEAVFGELEEMRGYFAEREEREQEREREERERSNNHVKKNHMVREIQNILGELGNRPSLTANPPRMSKLNSGSSRMGSDSDFSNFSIKDAINRPNQFTYY